MEGSFRYEKIIVWIDYFLNAILDALCILAGYSLFCMLFFTEKLRKFQLLYGLMHIVESLIKTKSFLRIFSVWSSYDKLDLIFYTRSMIHTQNYQHARAQFQIYKQYAEIDYCLHGIIFVLSSSDNESSAIKQRLHIKTGIQISRCILRCVLPNTQLLLNVIGYGIFYTHRKRKCLDCLLNTKKNWTMVCRSSSRYMDRVELRTTHPYKNIGLVLWSMR